MGVGWGGGGEGGLSCGGREEAKEVGVCKGIGGGGRLKEGRGPDEEVGVVGTRGRGGGGGGGARMRGG